MKKFVLYVLIIIAPVFSSCEDYLDSVAEVDGATEDVVFNNFQSVRGYFDKVWDCLDDYQYYQNQGMNVHFITAEMSDEGANVRKPLSNMGRYNNLGIWMMWNQAEYGWNDGERGNRTGNVIPNAFYGIRISNRVLEEVPGLGNLTGDQKNQLMGQAYFFRAWFYFEVIRRVGGFVKLDRKFFSDDDGNMERMTYTESSDWLINENLDKAIELLPDQWEKSQYGRPTKSSAYALRSMAQLYSASPLMRNGIDRTEVYTDYDGERVKLAAEYAKDCLEYLEKNSAVYDQRMMIPTAEVPYAQIFYYPSAQFMSKEMLWYRNNYGSTRNDDIATYWQTYRQCARTNQQGAGNFNPTLNMINKFETEKGYPCELTESGWVCEDPAWNSNVPFAKRDPRLEYFIILPGERFGNLSAPQTTANVLDQTAFYLCSWEGGRETDAASISDNAGRADVIGRFLLKKYQWPGAARGTNVATNYAEFSYSTSFIRATQVWLDYAEAMNEAYGPTVKPAGYQWSAVEAINKVRNRVGMPDVLNKFTTDRLTFRERIRNERAVELLCENQRWWDIRRWMIAEPLFANDPAPIKRARVTIKDGFTSINAANFPPGNTEEERGQAKYGACFNYVKESTPGEVHVFQRKHYWYPMRTDEVDRYPIFKQNPGW